MMNLYDLKYKLSVFFILALLLTVFGYEIYQSYQKSNSEEVYTICEIVDLYASSKDIGKRYVYKVNGKIYHDVCTSQNCVNSKVGSRFIIKFWKDHPEWVKIYFDKPVPNDVVPPLDGWREIPSYP